MANLYDFLEVDNAASTDLIEEKIEDVFNHWRWVAANHHDPEMVAQANEKLRLCETAREVLLSTEKRADYDKSLLTNVAGLGDTTAKPQKILTPPGSPLRVQQPQGVLSPWQCPSCKTQNLDNTKYCKSCGFELASNCPNCRALIDYQTSFCPECGVEVETAKHTQEMEAQISERERKRSEEQRQLLIPLEAKADEAFKMARLGCILYFIPIAFFASPVLWLMSMSRARSVLGTGQMPGDTYARDQAKKAAKWSRIGLILIGIALLFYVCYFVLGLGTLVSGY